MLAAPARDWSVFQHIFAEPWEVFQHTHPRYQTPYDDELVRKMLDCGTPAKMGSVEYRCLHCGQGKPLVSLSCQASLCLRWAKVSTDDWVSQGSQVLHEGGIYRHVSLTVPAMFRTPFYQNAAVLWRAFMRCGAHGLEDFYSTVRGKTLPGGSSTVLHTHGRHGQYPPHRHLLATSGGSEAQGACWEHLQSLPYALLRRQWQWQRLTRRRQTLKTDAVQRLVETCFRPSPDGLVPNVPKGAVPAQAQSVARYVAQYVVSPPIAVRRLERYDGARVTYHYRSHRTDRMEHETVTVDRCIGRMVPPVRPKGFKRIRYYGVHATKTCAKVKGVMQAALAQVEGMVKGAVKIIARLTDRQRDEQSTGRDPFRCPHCGAEMEVWRVWHPTYGVLYAEGEVLKRGTYTSSTQRAGP
jgi:hypothetical protein